MKSKEKAVREAAAALKTAIDEARKDGLAIYWPSTSDGLESLAISDTGRASVVVSTNTRDVDPAVAAEAGAAAQKAADEVIENSKADGAKTTSVAGKTSVRAEPPKSEPVKA